MFKQNIFKKEINKEKHRKMMTFLISIFAPRTALAPFESDKKNA